MRSLILKILINLLKAHPDVVSVEVILSSDVEKMAHYMGVERI